MAQLESHVELTDYRPNTLQRVANEAIQGSIWLMGSRSVFIAGGGPSGLAAAILFEQLGWDEIILAEQRLSPKDFEKNKSFNYQIDGRGQKLLQRIGLADRLPEVGVANTSFSMTVVKPDGSSKVSDAMIVNAKRPVCYWTTRRKLQTLLAQAAAEVPNGRIKLLYGHTVSGIRDNPETGTADVEVLDREGNIVPFAPDLILACDGLNSTMRQSAQACREVPDGHFSMNECPSPSAKLRYRVLNFPSIFQAARGEVQVDDRTMAYIFPSRHSDIRRTGSLFAFPVAGEDQPRSLNIIREADHHIWSIETAEELLAFLEDSHPQLDIRRLIPVAEAQDFVAMRPGKFPEPQYASYLHTEIGSGVPKTQFLLIGDSAHAFPPDLGLGVNSALEDLEMLATALTNDPDWRAAVQTYATKRLPESKALVRLVQTVFPEQYGTRPWAMKRWVAKFLVGSLLNKLAPSLVDQHAFLLTQDPDLSYTQIEHRKLRSERNALMIGLSLGAAILGIAVWVF